jgi:hypothetical protein
MVIDPSNIKIIYTEYSSTNNPATEWVKKETIVPIQ